MQTIEQLLGIAPTKIPESLEKKSHMRFSFLFFSDIRQDISNKKKYAFMREITLFADRKNFEAIYLPERHFHEFGSIYANSAIIAAYLIPQTHNIRFRTAGISLPLHHPAEIVEWWAMNDILSSGRVDLGFGSGWNKQDFIYAPKNYDKRRQICTQTIPIIQQLWRGETISFPGPNEEMVQIAVFPRPLQPEVNIWLLVTQNDEGFIYAGRKNYNIFTMLYSNNLDVMQKKIALYRQARQEVGLNPATGTITLMLHTLLLSEREQVKNAVEGPFKSYIKSSLNVHIQAIQKNNHCQLSEIEKDKILNYAYQRYFKTCAIFGTIEDGSKIVDQAISIGIDEIACLVDFGVDYSIVMKSLNNLNILVNQYR